MPHNEPECSQKVWYAIFKVKVIEGAHMIKIWQFLLYLLNWRPFCFQTWFVDAASWARVSCRKKIVCYLQGQGHSKGSFDQNIALCAISFELLIPWQPNLVWRYIVISQSVMWKKKPGLLHLRAGHSEGSECKCLSRWCLLNRLFFFFFFNQTWYCDASPWALVPAKRLMCCFQGQGHSKDSYDNMWRFLLYLLNCWSFCCQAWFIGTLT